MLPASLIGFVCQPYGVAGIFSFGENHKTRLGREPFGSVLTCHIIQKTRPELHLRPCFYILSFSSARACSALASTVSVSSDSDWNFRSPRRKA